MQCHHRGGMEEVVESDQKPPARTHVPQNPTRSSERTHKFAAWQAHESVNSPCPVPRGTKCLATRRGIFHRYRSSSAPQHIFQNSCSDIGAVLHEFVRLNRRLLIDYSVQRRPRIPRYPSTIESIKYVFRGVASDDFGRLEDSAHRCDAQNVQSEQFDKSSATQLLKTLSSGAATQMRLG